MMKDFAANTAVVAVTFAFALLAGEATLRLFPSLMDVAVIYRFHPTLRTEVATRLGLPVIAERKKISATQRDDGGPDFYIYEPGAKKVYMVDKADMDFGAVPVLQLDGNGFHNPPKKADRTTVDILVLGDSFTFGSTQDARSTFAARLEELTGLTTYNLGIGGTGLYEYVQLLRLFGIDLKPRIVIMSIYEGNDLRDAVRYQKARSGEKSFKRKKQRAGGLFAYSYALAFLKGAIELTVKAITRSRAIDFHYEVKAQGKAVPMNVANVDTDEVEHARAIAAGTISFDVFDDALASFADYADKHSFIPVVSYLPSAYSAYRSEITFSDKQVGQDVLFNADAQRAWLEVAAKRHKLIFADLTEAFVRSVASRPLTHFPANVHFTGEGHRIAAEALARLIATIDPQPAGG